MGNITGSWLLSDEWCWYSEFFMVDIAERFTVHCWWCTEEVWLGRIADQSTAPYRLN